MVSWTVDRISLLAFCVMFCLYVRVYANAVHYIVYNLERLMNVSHCLVPLKKKEKRKIVGYF